MEKFKRSLSVFSFAFAGALLAVYLFARFANVGQQSVNYREATPVHLTSQVSSESPQSQLPDLTRAAEKSVHAVVHIEVKVHGQTGDSFDNPLFDFFFGPDRPRGGNPRGYKEQP